VIIEHPFHTNGDHCDLLRGSTYKTNQSQTEGCLGILQVRLNVKHVEEEDAWLRGRGEE